MFTGLIPVPRLLTLLAVRRLIEKSCRLWQSSSQNSVDGDPRGHPLSGWRSQRLAQRLAPLPPIDAHGVHGLAKNTPCL